MVINHVIFERQRMSLRSIIKINYLLLKLHTVLISLFGRHHWECTVRNVQGYTVRREPDVFKRIVPVLDNCC